MRFVALPSHFDGDEEFIARFWAKVDKSGDCWLWTASCTPKGYGHISARRCGEKHMAYAHRVAYELLVGPVAKGLVIDHLCRVRHCVNPSHMETVTMTENNWRGNGWSGRNHRKTHCIHGHPLAGENLRIRKGFRECVTCVRETARRNYHRRKLEAT